MWEAKGRDVEVSVRVDGPVAAVRCAPEGIPLPFAQAGGRARFAVRFVRDSMGRELDFVVLRNDRPEFAVECKAGERDISRNLVYFAERTNIRRFYQVHQGQKDVEMAKYRARVLPMTALARELAV
jgi:hypothetical protein